MTTLEIIQLVCIGLILLAFVTLTAIKAIKNNWIGKLTECIEISIKEAETLWPKGHGSDKMNYVLDKVKAKCEELKIPFTIICKIVKIIIDKIVANYNIISK